MFGLTRWNPFEEMFQFQREVDRLFNQFWSDLPTRTAAWSSPSFQVHTNDDAWRIDVPLPGIDPQNVDLEVTGHNLTIRLKEPGEAKDRDTIRYEQTVTVPQFLDIEKVSAAHKFGMLQLTLPLKESVKPRRIQIETTNEPQKRLTAAA